MFDHQSGIDDCLPYKKIKLINNSVKGEIIMFVPLWEGGLLDRPPLIV